MNELGLHGTTETSKHDDRDTDAANDIAAGLFLKVFEYILEKDKKLCDIANSIPKMPSIPLLEKIRFLKRYTNADPAGFCVKSDGTGDRCNVENMSIINRFVCNSMPGEHLIGLLDLHQLDTEYIYPLKYLDIFLMPAIVRTAWLARVIMVHLS